MNDMAWTDWLKEADKRDKLKLIGGAAAALVAGGWAVYTWLHPKPLETKPSASIVAAPAIPHAAKPPAVIIIQKPEANNSSVAMAIAGNSNHVNNAK